MTQRRKCFSNLKQLFKSVTTLFPPTASLLLFKCHQRDSGLLSFPRQLNFNNWSWVCWLVTAFLCLMWRSGLHVSLSGCSNRAWRRGEKVWVAVCLTTRQTVMKDGRHSRKKGGAAAIRAWKDLTGTFSGRCKNNPIRTLPEPQRPADLLTSDGPWFGLLSKWAEFSSLEPDCRVFLRTNWLNHPINSVICKKKKTERQEGAGGGCGKQPRALTGSHYSDLCVNSAPRLLKHCHPAISSVYLHNTTQRLTARLPTDSSCSTERPNNLRQNLSESSVIRIQTYSN